MSMIEDAEVTGAAAPKPNAQFNPNASAARAPNTNFVAGGLQAKAQAINAMTPPSAEASAFLKQLAEQLATPVPALAAKGTIAFQQTDIPGGFAFTYDKRAYILILSELAPVYDARVPTSVATTMVAQKITSLGFQPFNSIIIDRTEYSRVKELATIIVQEFVAICCGAEYGLNLADMTSDQFDLNSNIDAVRAYISGNSPHVVPSRMDIGFILSSKPRDSFGNRSNNYDMTSTPIVAVGGYVDFVQHNYVESTNQGNRQVTKWLPCVNITEIYSPFRSPAMNALGVAIGAEYFLRNEGWRRQFQDFSADKPNIGNMTVLQDAKGNDVPIVVKTLAQLDDYIRIYTIPTPVLIIHDAEGRCRMPGLGLVTGSDEASRVFLSQALSTFVGTSINLPNPLCGKLCIEIHGDLVAKDRVDSRTVDYNWALHKLGADPAIAQLKLRPADAMQRADYISGLVSNFNRRYVVTQKLAERGALYALLTALAGKIRINGLGADNSSVGADMFMRNLEAALRDPLPSMAAPTGAAAFGFGGSVPFML